MRRILQSDKLDFVVVSGATVFCSLLTFLYNILVRNFIAPDEYGIYVTADLLLVYFNYLQLGVLNSFNRDYPQLIGGGNILEADYKKNVVWSYLLIIYGVVGLFAAFIFLVLLLNAKMNTKMAFGFLVNIPFAFLNILYVFFDVSIKSNGRFIYSAKMLILKTVAAVIAGTICVIFLGFYGLFAASAVSLLCIVIFNRRFFLSLKIVVDFPMILEMIRFGSPLLLSALVWTLMLSIDKFVILAYLSVADLGTYSVALLGFSMLVLIPQAISQILYVKMSNFYGETKNADLLFKQAKGYTRSLSLVSAFVAVFAYNLLPPFISLALPDYTGGVYAAQILVVGVAFYSTSMLFSNILSVLKFNFKLLASTSLVCLMNLGLTILCVKVFGKNISSVALGTSFSFLMYSIAVISATCLSLKKEFLSTIFLSWFPIIVLLVPSIFIAFVVKNELYLILLNLLLFATCLLLFYRTELKKLLNGLV